MACLKPIEARQWAWASAVPGRRWQGHTCRQGPVQTDCWWLSECALGAMRGKYTLGVWGLWQPYSWQPAQISTSSFMMVTHADLCAKTHSHTCGSILLCFSTTGLRMIKRKTEPVASPATSTTACQRPIWCNATTPLLWQKSVFISST